MQQAHFAYPVADRIDNGNFMGLINFGKVAKGNFHENSMNLFKERCHRPTTSFCALIPSSFPDASCLAINAILEEGSKPLPERRYCGNQR